MKAHHKDIQQLLKVAEKAIKGDPFMYRRKLSPPLILEMAEMNNDSELVSLASNAHGKKITSDEFENFSLACTPAKIVDLCKKSIQMNLEKRDPERMRA